MKRFIQSLQLPEGLQGDPKYITGSNNPMTEREIINTLYRMRSVGNRILFPNVFFHRYDIESDLIEISKSGYVIEYEVKTSLADLLKEYDKKRWKRDIGIKQYYFVLPGAVYANHYEKINQYIRPEHGLITYHGHFLKYRKPAKQNRKTQPVRKQSIDRLYRKIYFRYWNMR